MNEQESIKFELTCCEILYPFDEIIVQFSHKNDNYILGIDGIREETESFYDLLSVALENEAKLHKSITKNIGYLWNEVKQKKSGLVYFEIENVKYWVGLDNLLWSTRSSEKLKLSTWLYNDSEGSIILEITPNYPWHFEENPEIKEGFIPYEEWLKSFKPLLIRVIPRDVAIKWKNQAKKILDQIEENVKKYNEEQNKENDNNQ